MKCVAYIRVSTDKQVEEGFGLDSQKRDIEDYCRKHEMVISEWYIDAGLSGMEMTKRVELQRLISDLNDIDKILVYKLDRLARDSVDSLFMIEKIFAPKNVEVVSVHDFAKYQTPQDKFQTHIMAAVAEYDRNTMLLRMRGGMLERVKNGYWMGGGNTPYCYKYDKNTGILVPIEERAEKMRTALEMYISGSSECRISKAIGVAEPTVRTNLLSYVNVGMIPYKGKLYQGRHEPIFDKERWELGKQLRKTRAVGSRNVYPPNLLTGLCVCGVCGCKMRYQKYRTSPKKKSEQTIVCCSHDKWLSYLPNFDGSCDAKMVFSKNVEPVVEKEILKISMDISSYKPVKQKSKVEVISGQIEKESSKLKRLYELYAEGNDTVLDMIKKQEDRIFEMKKTLAEEEKRESNKPEKSFVYDNIKKIADVWDNIDKTQKNKILRIIIDKIVIVNDDIKIFLRDF